MNATDHEHYVDGFIVPVPADRIGDYRKIADLAREVWLDHGAISYVEAVADDVKPGKLTSFPQSVDLRDGEVVVIAWITYRSRAHRDEVNARVMSDPRMDCDPANMPFDGKRLVFGGFKVFVQGHSEGNQRP